MKRSPFQIMTRLAGLVKPLTGYMILAICMGVLGNLAASFLTILGILAVCRLLGFSVALSTPTLLLLCALFGLVRGFLRYGEQSCNHFIAFKLLALIRDRVFASLRRLAPAKLQGRDKGDLISVITSDIELLEVFYAHTISPIVIAALFCLILSLLIGSYAWQLGLLALAAYLTIGVVIPLGISKLNGDSGLKFRQNSGGLSAYVLESLRGLPETLQYGDGSRRLEEIVRRSEELAQEDGRIKAKAGVGNALVGLLLLGFDLAMLFAAATLYRRGALGFDGVLVSTVALMSSFGPVVSLANLGSTLQYTFAAGNRVLDILDEVPVVSEISGQEEVEFSGAGARNLSFAYEDQAILKDLTLEIPQGQITGITGRSGSGKSTFLKLLMRFWEAQEGEALVSQRSVNQINTRNLRDMESFVTQETHLFRDTILNNLRIAKADATREEVEAACKKASVHDFIMGLPQNYDTPIGELGDTLSGGERQRLGLARAFLHDAPFLLLDEPTSNLDSLNEAVILRSLHQEHGDQTVVLVSHRQSTMGIADRVYSVENGRLS